MKTPNLKPVFFLLMKGFLSLFLCSNACFAQRPMTDSIIRKMNNELYRGNYNEAIALADIGYNFALIEEPENKDKWELFFGYKKVRLIVNSKADLEKGEEFINQFKLDKAYSNDEAQYLADQIINVKADICRELGDYETAKDLYRLVYGKNSNDFLYEKKYYNRMNNLYSGTNQLDSAFYYSNKLIDLLEAHGDTLNGFYFGSLMQHAISHASLGNKVKSDSLIEHLKNNYGGFKKTSNFGLRMSLLSQMSYVASLSGDFERAYQLAKESESIFLKLRGKRDYEYSKFLVSLGSFQFQLNKKEAAYGYYSNIPSLFSLYTKQRTDLLSIRGKEIFMNKNNSIRDHMLFMLEYFDNEYLEYNKGTFDNILYQKSSFFQSLDGLKNHFQNTSNKEDREEFNSWEENHKEYYKWLTKHGASEDSSKMLANQLRIQEKSLFKKAGVKGSYKATNLDDLSNHLPKNDVAIEFIRYEHIKSKEIRYGALVFSHKNDKPIFVRLCDEVDLIKAMDYDFAETDYEYTQRVYNSGTLYDLIWKPLEPYLKNTENCYASLSGLLYKIALDASFPENALMHPKIHLVHSTAAIVEDIPNLPINPSVSLYGGIKYNLRKVEEIDSLSGTIAENVHTLHRGGQADKWNYLKGTENEVKEISRILKKSGYEVQLKMGTECSEGAFKNELNGKSPDILHIATHGYYPVAADSVLSYTHSASYARSGLVMAGANTSKTSNAPIEGYGDGILTAPEITALNLANTQLVVLSACETGKGKVSHVDEIYGLQRAFKITGAQYVIYTLWKIPDESAKEFMVYFYSTLSKGNTIEDSFFQTKEYMKKTYPVFDWAGFQLIR